MVLLNIKFAKYQIYFGILPKYPKNFIGIKEVWPQPQPPRQIEVKFKIYTPIDYGFTCSDSTFVVSQSSKRLHSGFPMVEASTQQLCELWALSCGPCTFSPRRVCSFSKLEASTQRLPKGRPATLHSISTKDPHRKVDKRKTENRKPELSTIGWLV